MSCKKGGKFWRQPLPPAELLRELFSYDPATGIVRWKKTICNRAIAGNQVAPRARNKGSYHKVMVDGKDYPLHRIIWRLVTGEDPDCDIDHGDTDGFNNRWDNLRKGSRAQNMWNTGIQSHNTSGHKGVWKRGENKFCAYIGYQGKRLLLGIYPTFEEARDVREAKAKELYGEFYRSGAAL